MRVSERLRGCESGCRCEGKDESWTDRETGTGRNGERAEEREICELKRQVTIQLFLKRRF
jgi:hypothetical protein